jgi:succinylglutamate desuccinylase
MLKQIDSVCLVGGTHPNELVGVKMICKYKKYPELVQRDSFKYEMLLANPAALELGRRYVDEDLNRQFLKSLLTNSELTTSESVRAREIAAHLKSDLIIDLHSTTANMGLTILPTNKNPFNLRLASYLTTLDPSVRVSFGVESQDASRLRSLAPFGLGIEVGPIAQNALSADLFKKTDFLIQNILDYIQAHNEGQMLPAPSRLTAYQTLFSIDYPKNPSDGSLIAMIHPDRNFQDFKPIYQGEPIFWNFFTGETIFYEDKTTLHPIFVGEVSYIEKGIAMSMTEKVTIDIPNED